MEQGTVFSSGVYLADPLNRDLLRRRLRERGGFDIAHKRSLGMSDMEHPPEKNSERMAAVLVPLVVRPEGSTVLLTQRTDHLHHHAGQISFPGGMLEEDDPDEIACALRETEEETGVPASRVDVVGTLDEHVTGTGFRVVPVVALIHPPFKVAPDPFEVADVFEVPLAFILNPANHQTVARTINGRQRPYYAISFDHHYIWGATAGMLINLYNVLKA